MSSYLRGDSAQSLRRVRRWFPANFAQEPIKKARFHEEIWLSEKSWTKLVLYCGRSLNGMEPSPSTAIKLFVTPSFEAAYSREIQSGVSKVAWTAKANVDMPGELTQLSDLVTYSENFRRDSPLTKSFDSIKKICVVSGSMNNP